MIWIAEAENTYLIFKSLFFTCLQVLSSTSTKKLSCITSHASNLHILSHVVTTFFDCCTKLYVFTLFGERKSPVRLVNSSTSSFRFSPFYLFIPQKFQIFGLLGFHFRVAKNKLVSEVFSSKHFFETQYANPFKLFQPWNTPPVPQSPFTEGS